MIHHLLVVSWTRIALTLGVVAVSFASLAAAGSAKRPPEPIDVQWARAIVVRGADLPKTWIVFPPATLAGYVELMGGCNGVPNVRPPSGLAYSSADGPGLSLRSVDSFACIYPTALEASAFAQGLARAYAHGVVEPAKSVTKGKLQGSMSVRPYQIPGAASFRNFRTVIRTTKPKSTVVFDIGFVRVGRAVLELTMDDIPTSMEARLVHSMIARMAYPPGRPA